jgi:hypothetical protein
MKESNNFLTFDCRNIDMTEYLKCKLNSKIINDTKENRQKIDRLNQMKHDLNGFNGKYFENLYTIEKYDSDKHEHISNYYKSFEDCDEFILSFVNKLHNNYILYIEYDVPDGNIGINTSITFTIIDDYMTCYERKTKYIIRPFSYSFSKSMLSVLLNLTNLDVKSKNVTFQHEFNYYSTSDTNKELKFDFLDSFIVMFSDDFKFYDDGLLVEKLISPFFIVKNMYNKEYDDHLPYGNLCFDFQSMVYFIRFYGIVNSIETDIGIINDSDILRDVIVEQIKQFIIEKLENKLNNQETIRRLKTKIDDQIKSTTNEELFSDDDLSLVSNLKYNFNNTFNRMTIKFGDKND